MVMMRARTLLARQLSVAEKTLHYSETRARYDQKGSQSSFRGFQSWDTFVNGSSDTLLEETVSFYRDNPIIPVLSHDLSQLLSDNFYPITSIS